MNRIVLKIPRAPHRRLSLLRSSGLIADTSRLIGGGAVVLTLTTLLNISPASAQEAPSCQAGQEPELSLVFAGMEGELGAAIGDPTECEHADPTTGDTLQLTTTGLLSYRYATNTPIFSSGFLHWGLFDSVLVFWITDPDEQPGPAPLAPLPATTPPPPVLAAPVLPIPAAAQKPAAASAPIATPVPIVRTAVPATQMTLNGIYMGSLELRNHYNPSVGGTGGTWSLSLTPTYYMFFSDGRFFHGDIGAGIFTPFTEAEFARAQRIDAAETGTYQILGDTIRLAWAAGLPAEIVSFRSAPGVVEIRGIPYTFSKKPG